MIARLLSAPPGGKPGLCVWEGLTERERERGGGGGGEREYIHSISPLIRLSPPFYLSPACVATRRWRGAAGSGAGVARGGEFDSLP